MRLLSQKKSSVIKSNIYKITSSSTHTFQGEVHTTGSPIDIKRTLGSGYKLTITYPESLDIEEKTRQALEVTRIIVKNASLIDVTREEVEINVPFFDEHGVSTE